MLLPSLRQIQLARGKRRLQRLPRRRLEQLPLFHIETLHLELTLEREGSALRLDARLERAVGLSGGAAAQHVIALDLLLLELLLLEALLELKLLEAPCVGGAEIVAPRADALLKVEIERVLLLPELKVAALDGRACGGSVCALPQRGGETQRKHDGKSGGGTQTHFHRTTAGQQRFHGRVVERHIICQTSKVIN
jgi:hypothetical protein